MEKPLGSSIPRTLEEVCDPRHMGSFWRSQPTTPNFHCRAGGTSDYCYSLVRWLLLGCGPISTGG